MSKRAKPSAQKRRLIKISVRHPIFVEVEVARGECDDAWEIVAVRQASTNPTPRSLHECMDDGELDAMDKQADQAEDLT